MTVNAADFNTILDIIDEALLKGNTKQAVIDILLAFAKGKDGILGTVDDRLTADQIVLLEGLINDGTVQRLVEKMYKSNLVQRVLKFMFPCLYN